MGHSKVNIIRLGRKDGIVAQVSNSRRGIGPTTLHRAISKGM